MGNTNYSFLKRISLSQNFYGNYVYYFHNQLTIKPMNITYGKTTHFVGLTKPKQTYEQSPVGSDQPTHKSQQLKNTWTSQPNFSNKWTAGTPSHQVLTCLISQKTDMCPPGDESFLHKLKSHHLSSDIKLKVMWQKAGKAGKASASCYFFLLQLIQSRNQSCHDQTSEAPEMTQNQLIFILKICIL